MSELFSLTDKRSMNTEIEEESQTTESDAIALFNESFKKGIKLLIELEIVKESPESIATYLHETKGLDKVGFCVGFSLNASFN